MVFEPAKLPRDGHAAAHHIVIFTSSPQNCTAVLTQPRRRNYVHGLRTTEGALTLQMRAATACSLLRIGKRAVGGVFHRAALMSLNP